MSAVAVRTSWALGRSEARRLVVHPAYLAGALVVVPMMGLQAVTFMVAELAQVPFVMLGGGLLGVLAARWLRWRRDDDDFTRGSQVWHAASLALLCCLALLVVCLSDAQRKRPLVVLGSVLVTATVVVGWAQLP